MCMLHTYTCARTHVRMDSHTGTHLHAYIYICKHSRARARIQREPVDTSANIIKLDQNNCLRKLIRYNASPLNVNFFNKGSTRG